MAILKWWDMRTFYSHVENRKLYCIGAGKLAISMCNQYEKLHLENKIEAFLDNDKRKAGQHLQINGKSIPILPFGHIHLIAEDTPILCITTQLYPEILLQLEGEKSASSLECCAFALMDLAERNSPLYMPNFLNRTYDFFHFLDELLLQKEKNFDSFRTLSLQIRFFDSYDKKACSLLFEYLKLSTNVYHKILILRFIYEIDEFTTACLKEYMQLVESLPEEKNDLKYWLIMDVSYMIFNFPQSIYSEFYLDRRRIMQAVCDAYKLQPERHSLEKQNGKRKICILALHLADRLDAITGFAIQFANDLAENDFDVMLIPSDVWFYDEGDSIVRPIAAKHKFSSDGFEAISDQINPSVMVEFVTGRSVKERLSCIIDKVASYNPKLIIDYLDDFSVPLAALKGKYPIASISSRGYALSSFFDYYLAHDKEVCLQANKVYRSVEEEQITTWNPIAKYVPPKSVYHRENFELKETDFLMITVGARLRYELDDEFCRMMDSLLQMHSDMKWILVGHDISLHFQKKYASLYASKQIICWGYENDLPALCKICDLYVNPDRMGAGKSIELAMYAGLPLATTSFFSDVMPVIGLENTAGNNYSDLKNLILQMYQNQEKRKSFGQKLKTRAFEIQKSVSLSNVIKDLQDVWQ